MKYITVFADASFCFKTGAAGIAVWARTNNRFHRMSQRLTFPVLNSAEAETIALGTGILSALENLAPEPGDRLSVQSDCLHALNAVVLFQCSTQMERSFAVRVDAAVREARVSLHPKHVKGHTGVHDARSYANDWCDREARDRMRESRKLLTVKVGSS
jgi:ribonuclease HI